MIRKIIESDHIAAERLCTEQGAIYTFLNPVSYLVAIKHKELFDNFNGIMVDGVILATAIKLLYGRRIRRRSFDMTSVATLILQYVISEKKTIYLIGASQEEIERSVDILQRQFPGLRIIGYRNGYFSSYEEKIKEYEKIINLKPNFVIVGMGTPVQEQFLSELKKNGYTGIGFTCGGFISQLSMKGIRYYPKWTDRYNLRFIYRFYKEKHTRKRYVKALFLFPLYFIWNRLK